VTGADAGGEVPDSGRYLAGELAPTGRSCRVIGFVLEIGWIIVRELRQSKARRQLRRLLERAGGAPRA
jgi:hypothetical protein